jgi:hypothetical protein
LYLPSYLPSDFCGSLEGSSLARAVLDELRQRGVRVRVDGKTVLVGTRRPMTDSGNLESLAPHIDGLLAGGKTR